MTMFCKNLVSKNPSKKFAKIAILDLPDAQKSSFGRVREPCLRVWGYVEQSWCVLSMPGMHLGASKLHLRGVLGPSCCVLSGSWKGFGDSRRLPRSLLETFFADFLSSGAICENSKKPRKTNGFSLIFEVLEGLWGSENPKKSIKVRSERLRGAKSELREAWGGQESEK